MEQFPTSAFLLVFALGLGLGYLVALLYQRLQLRDSYVARSILDRDYVARPLFDNLQQQADQHYDNYQHKVIAEQGLQQQLTRLQVEFDQLEKQLAGQQQEMQRLQAESKAHFERIANQLLEEKSERFSLQNAKQLQQILHPLQERIQTFEKQVERRFVEETRDRVSLKEEIKHLRALNNQLSADANNLAGALRGDNKSQGDWGEWQLEGLLKASGLEPGIHYRSQASFADQNGNQKRPDFIINLPDDKHLIVDSKVSLTAYERYCSSPEQAPERAAHLRNHCQSMRRHVKDLSRKNYTQLYQINSPDYLLLFVPIEPAFSLALKQDQQLFLDALDERVVLVTSSTLLATLRTVSYIWKQEKQKQHVLDIARQSGLLYDKFVGFVSNMQEIGRRLDQSQRSFNAAMNKLSDSKRYGDTLVGRAERLRKLGAKAQKRLPKELVYEEEE
ncbi:MAG: DNA recombination protein RmuC [Bacteroidota bacterium]